MISSVAKSQNLDCSDFKIGKFKLETTNYNLPVSNVIRTEKIQKESSAESETELEGRIEWISDCSYELIYTTGSIEMKGKKVSVEIEKIEGKKAICKSTCEGFPGIVLEFEMEKLQ
jgi:hypothetical protein